MTKDYKVTPEHARALEQHTKAQVGAEIESITGVTVKRDSLLEDGGGVGEGGVWLTNSNTLCPKH